MIDLVGHGRRLGYGRLTAAIEAALEYGCTDASAVTMARPSEALSGLGPQAKLHPGVRIEPANELLAIATIDNRERSSCVGSYGPLSDATVFRFFWDSTSLCHAYHANFMTKDGHKKG